MADPTPTDLGALLDEEREKFQSARRVLSYDEYLALAAAHPRRHTRDAARYLRDLFDHFGTEAVERPYGRATRWRLFDLPWEDESGRRDALVGHEALQGDLYRALSNFARQGRVNRLVLLHGPNGSAKSTFVASVMRAMEHYATLDEGALYRYTWVFPRGKVDGGRIGFGSGREEGPRPGESYALLDESAIDAKVLCELRDPAALPDERCYQKRQLEALRGAWLDLGAEQRAALELREVQGLSFAEAAARLRTTPQAVKTRVCRTRALLKAKLG